MQKCCRRRRKSKAFRARQTSDYRLPATAYAAKAKSRRAALISAHLGFF